jgi:hypothetical protein
MINKHILTFIKFEKLFRLYYSPVCEKYEFHIFHLSVAPSVVKNTLLKIFMYFYQTFIWYKNEGFCLILTVR